jgi:hypothetical protein
MIARSRNAAQVVPESGIERTTWAEVRKGFVDRGHEHVS